MIDVSVGWKGSMVVYQAKSTFFLPFCLDLTAPIHSLIIKPMLNALDIQWDHDFHLCRNFTVYLDGAAVPECTNIAAMNCTIENLDAGVQYEVNIVATESYTGPVEISQTVTTLDASASAG